MGHPTDQPLTAELAQEVCERTNRQVVVNGDIAELGGRYLLTLDATDCHTGKVLAAAKTEAAAKSDVLDALDHAADTVRRGLGESKQSIAEFQVPISQVTTPSIDALEAYSMGLYLSGQGRAEAEVMPFYKRAIELDPQFAMAYAKLADVYTNDDETALATQYYSKALTLSDHLSAREKMALQAQYADATDMQRGVAAYKMWAEMYPNDVLPEANLSDRYMQLGEFPAAIQTGERALALAPDNANEFDILARAYKRASQFDKAKAVVSQAVARGKDYVRLHDTLNEIAWAENNQPAMAREAQWADQKGTWFSFDLEGCIAADGGQLDRAEGYFEKAISTAERDHLNTTADEVRLDQAEAEILLGQLDRARTTLQRIAREDSDSAEFVLLNIKLGQLAPAEAFLKAHPTIESQPSDPLTYLNLPRIRAALALAHNRPLDAIAALDGVQQYDLSDSGLNAMSLRGKAYLLAHQPDQAAAQYKKILQNPGLPVTAELSLAHLGLAEAEEMRGNLPAADKEYSAFLARWTGADPHNVVVATAKTDLDALRRNEEEARR